MNALVKVPDLPRAPPVNIAAEQAVLGAILMNNEAFGRVSRFLEARHFCEDLHRRIYEVAGKLIEDGKVASPVTLKTFLGDHDLGGITVTQYLARLCSEAVTVLNCGDYAATLVDLFCQREIMMVAEDMSSLAACLPVGIRPSAVIDEISERLHKLREETATDEVSVSVADTMDELIERAVAASEGRHVPGMLTGLTDVDRTIGGGLRPGRLVVLAGRPGAGKTVLLTAIARRAAQKGAGVAIFSLEIDRDENLARMAANALAHKNHAPDYRDILTQALDAGQIEDLRVARDWLAKLPLELDCTGGISMAQIESRAKRMAARLERRGSKLGVVCIDYLQLLSMGKRYEGNQVNELGEAVLAAKNMAKRLGVCVILLSQLSRGVEARDNKRPLMSDLRGSGNIEEHADIVGLLYRPNYYDRNDPKMTSGNDPALTELMRSRENDLEVIIDKNRLGPTTTVTLFCNVARSQVDNKTRGY